MSTQISSITTQAARSAELIFAGPEALHARTTRPAEQAAFRTSNKVEGR
ncbi:MULTISPECIES: hypothetical protein [Micrococcaceae]|jgi:hypothetical protein|uniref:Uncharacterized protein n=1 Tax=Paeniglutamicibacter psychrophenolicus TaxID=257454 RepID=A0ABS4W8V1_9MICC|nr:MULTISPECIES: hypothetical protein [Micrococcaceae]MBP2372617.1 hypothetical protein [Paeniglutamicibacter psychrophenolicus]MDQ0095118.1 hypothetical protein [Paeniglutamicibacter psychrophenolicus]